MKPIKSVFVTIIYITVLGLNLSSCYKGSADHLYNNVGQSPEDIARSNPNSALNLSPANINAPNYYYRYGPTVPAAPTPVYVAPPQYQYNSPYPPQGYQQPYQAGSRFYSNPYDIPPSPYYNQPYDSDQYYVPPSYYYNEGNQTSANRKPRTTTHY